MKTEQVEIVVTGAGGFIGRRLCRLLTMQGRSVAGWTRSLVDLENPEKVAGLMASARPAITFHLASAGVDAARAHDTDLVAREVAMVASLVNALPAGSRLVMAGSMSEYGGIGVLSEVDVPAPKTVYGIAKLAAGHYATAYGEERGLDVRIARLFGVYGTGEGPQRFFQTLLSGIRAGVPIPLSDGLQQRDFIHVDDAVLAMAQLAEIPRSTDCAVVNIGTGVAVSVRDAALWIAAAAGASPALLHFGARPRSPGDADLLCADITRFVSLIGTSAPQRLGSGVDLSLFA